MNLQSLETKHYIMIGLGLLVLYILFVQDKSENFSAFQLYPHIPPKYWNPRRRTHWSPWWYYENEYQPAVPGVSLYDSAEYRLPYGAEKHISGPSTPAESVENMVAEEDDPSIPPVVPMERVVPAHPKPKVVDLGALIVLVILGIIVYNIFFRPRA